MQQDDLSEGRQEVIAYFRDALVAGQTQVLGASDGETYGASLLLPDGTVQQWGTITFRSSFNGQSNCFVSPTFFVCGATV